MREVRSQGASPSWGGSTRTSRRRRRGRPAAGQRSTHAPTVRIVLLNGTIRVSARGPCPQDGPSHRQRPRRTDDMPVTDPQAKAKALYEARRTRVPIAPFTDAEPD